MAYKPIKIKNRYNNVSWSCVYAGFRTRKGIYNTVSYKIESDPSLYVDLTER